MQSSTQMRGMHQGGVTFAQSNRNKMPSSIGELVIGDFITPEYALAPWSEHTVPDDFDEWSEREKVDWVNAHTDYAYIDPGHTVDLDTEAIVFVELPPTLDTETVGLLFRDNHAERLDFEEADELVREQTGHSIADWMQSTSPGTGQVILPQEEEQ